MKRWLSDKKWRVIISGLIITAVPIIGLTLFVRLQTAGYIKNDVIKEDQQSAIIVSERIKDALGDEIRLGNLLASRPRLRSAIKGTDREELIRHLKDFIDNSIAVDRAYITNPRGKVLADYPSDPSVLNMDVSQRDWYKGVSKKWLPYVSGGYLRTAKPQRYLFAIAVPLRADDKSIIGVLVLQPEVNYLKNILASLPVQQNQITYVVDKNGNLLYHSKYMIDRAIDTSDFPAVQRVRKGQTGAGIFAKPDGERVLTAYRCIEGYGWGVVVERPEKEVFGPLKRVNFGLFVFASIMLLTGGYFAYKRSVLIYSLQKFAEELEARVDKRTAQLKETNDKLEAANKELEAFSYSVSHDLRAPLRHMSGFVKLLQKRLFDDPDKKNHDYMVAIVQASKKMEMLVDDLLSFSHMGRAEMQNRKVNFNTLLKNTLREIQDEVKGRDIKWEIDELPDVYGDQSMLKLVLVNLISNAVKYTSTCSRAEIRFGYKEEGDEFIFFVKDNGAGFDMKQADRLFGVFQRLHAQDEFEGTGIGLANVRRIISRHGGRTWAEGAVEQGATFYFTLPKTKEI